MKKIIILILIFAFFSCDKDESNTLSTKYSKEEIFNAVVGTWKFNRLAYDPDFKNVKKIDAKDCTEYDRTIFYKDSTMKYTFIEGCSNLTPDRVGNFYIRFGGKFENDMDRTYIIVEHSGVFLTPGQASGGSIGLYSFTDSTLVISDVIYYSDKGDEYNERNLYSELKRVK